MRNEIETIRALGSSVENPDRSLNRASGRDVPFQPTNLLRTGVGAHHRTQSTIAVLCWREATGPPRGRLPPCASLANDAPLQADDGVKPARLDAAPALDFAPLAQDPRHSKEGVAQRPVPH